MHAPRTFHSNLVSRLFGRKELTLIDLLMFLIAALVFALLAGVIKYCAKSMKTDEEFSR